MADPLRKLPRSHFGNVEIETAAIANLAVTTGKINDLAVTTGKLASGALAASTAGRAVMADDYLRQSKLDRRYTFEEFCEQPVSSRSTGTATSGATGATNIMAFAENVFEYHIKGAGQTITVPVIGAAGLDISLDQTDAEGVEITQGITARSRGAFVIGTDAAFAFSAKLKVADASGAGNLFVGFRKAEAYQADEDDYADMAAIGINGTANPNTIKLATILNGGATTSTDTTDTWADAAEKTLKVLVSAAGVVTYQINGAAPTVTAAFTFDTGDTVVPFIYFLHAADVAGAVELSEWTCGLQ